MRLEELLKIVEEDSPFYARSGGGITVGGGEPLAQAEFVQELLKESRRRGIDTAIETCGYGSWEDLKRTLSYANLIFYDIKHMDSNKHRAFTGVGNELILENITRFSSCLPDVKVIARTPVVPGFNDSEANITATARFLARIKGVTEYELLPYHGFGEPKYHQLDRLYLLSGSKVPSQEHMRLLKEIAHCIIASSRT